MKTFAYRVYLDGDDERRAMEQLYMGHRYYRELIAASLAEHRAAEDLHDKEGRWPDKTEAEASRRKIFAAQLSAFNARCYQALGWGTKNKLADDAKRARDSWRPKKGRRPVAARMPDWDGSGCLTWQVQQPERPPIEFADGRFTITLTSSRGPQVATKLKMIEHPSGVTFGYSHEAPTISGQVVLHRPIEGRMKGLRVCDIGAT